MKYSKILSKVIKTAKMFHYNNQITHSTNKIKAMWNITKNETGGNNIKMIKRTFIILIRNMIKVLMQKF